jgi:hypothetical protein
MTTNRRLWIVAATFGLLAVLAITGLTTHATAQDGDPIEEEKPGLNNFVSKVPDAYFQKQAVRKLDWQLVKAGYAINATTEACGARYAGYAGSEQLERLVFQFIATDDLDKEHLATRMDALLKLKFDDVPANAWAYQVVTSDGQTSHLCIDGTWTTDD